MHRKYLDVRGTHTWVTIISVTTHLSSTKQQGKLWLSMHAGLKAFIEKRDHFTTVAEIIHSTCPDQVLRPAFKIEIYSNVWYRLVVRKSTWESKPVMYSSLYTYTYYLLYVKINYDDRSVVLYLAASSMSSAGGSLVMAVYLWWCAGSADVVLSQELKLKGQSFYVLLYKETNKQIWKNSLATQC